MSILLDNMLKDVSLPRFFRVSQTFPEVTIPKEEIAGVIRKKLGEEAFSSKIKPGMRIAITAGSRGISNIDLITETVVGVCREAGAQPFIVPAMGSHGGGTAEGQREVLRSYGITEETMGCPVLASMEVKEIGKTMDGRPSVIDRYAAEADGIILLNRVKAHSSFRGRYESGLMKMMAIGLGKQAGAQNCHDQGYRNMARNIVNFGSAVLEHVNILFGIAIIENARDVTGEVHVLLPEEIPEKEPELLERANAAMARILVDHADLLIVDEIGKNYSGVGMDPNVTGTYATPGMGGGFRTKKVTVLGMSESSHGNALGIGMAETTTKEVFDAIDYDAMYINGLTTRSTIRTHIPAVLKNDLQAIQFALRSIDDAPPGKERMIRIPNSRDLEVIQLSEVYLAEAEHTSGIEILSAPEPLLFDERGMLADRFRS